MKIQRVTYFALVALISTVSCTKDAVEPPVIDWNEDIYFRTTLASVASSRGQDMTLDLLDSFQVTCFNAGDMKKDDSGVVSPYFENATFIRKDSSAGITFISSPFEEPREWPAASGLMTFFAFSPSLGVMAENNEAAPGSAPEDYFNLRNNSTASDAFLTTDYRLGTIRVNPDISRQFDFVTAAVRGERWKDFSSGVDLAFSHQMSQVELKAWGDSGYDFEIVGVRIGNPVVEGTFLFPDNPASGAGRWEDAPNSVKDKVEYLYRAAGAASDDNLSADRIFRINGEEHNTLQSAGSIMGQGGCAMVIPTLNSRWEGLEDPDIDSRPYATDRMYFSILMRVSSKSSDKQVYPYPDNPDGLTVIYYATDNEGVIVAQVYPGETEGTFFTDSGLEHPYVAPEGISIKEFGWAAVPVDADWSAGKRYVYTLNYSDGIGLHDPADPKPGTPITGQPSITWGVSISPWGVAAPDDDYTPGLDVP